MFIERLNKQQVRKFAKQLVQKQENQDCDVTTAKDQRGWVIRIQARKWEEAAYDIHVRLKDDYNVDVRKSGLLTDTIILGTWVRFLHERFGPAYKEAYLRKAAEIFEEGNETRGIN